MKRIETYEGNEPYIFISYAHRDTEQVMPTIRSLAEKGYRIWYDDGIAPGSEWPEYIAQHLGNSSLLIAMISERYIASNNCKRELTYGLSKDIPFLGVILEPTEMSMGMEMQLSAHQCVLRYKYSSHDRFIEKICSNPDMQICKVEEIPVEVIETVKEIPQPEKIEQTEIILEEVLKKDRKKTVKSEEKEDKGKKKKKSIKWLIPALIVLVLLGSLGGLFSGFGKKRIYLTDSYFVIPSNSYVNIRSTKVTKDMISKVGGMKKLTNLAFENDDLSDVDLSKLSNKDQITTLSFKECTGIDDFLFLGEYENLTSITICGCEVKDGTIELDTLPLKLIEITQAPGFTDFNNIISDVNKETLQTIIFSDTGVSDISLLENCSGLVNVCGDHSAVENIDSLASLEELRQISFNDCKLEAVEKEFDSLRLEKISFENCGIKELKGFQNCTVVKSVNIGGAILEEVPAFITKSLQTIEELNVANVKDENVQKEILEKVLMDSDGLESIIAGGISSTSGSYWTEFLGRRVHLQTVDLSECSLEGSLNFAGCKELKDLNLSNNHITEVILPKDMEEINHIDLSNNKISDPACFSGLEIKEMYFGGNDINAKSLFDQIEFKCNRLYLNYDESLLELTRAEIDAKVGKLVLRNVPKDQIVKLDDFGTSVTVE